MTCANAAKAFKVRIIQTFCPRLAFIANFDWLLALAVFVFIICILKRSHENTYYLYWIPLGYIYPFMELSHILPSCLTENVSKQRGVPFFMHLPGIVPSFCEILYLHLICTQLSTSPIRRRRTDRKGEQICNFQMNKYRFSKWTNTFFQAYKYKCRDISEWVPISTSTPAPPWYNGKVTHSAPQHPTTPHRSPSP